MKNQVLFPVALAVLFLGGCHECRITSDCGLGERCYEKKCVAESLVSPNETNVSFNTDTSAPFSETSSDAAAGQDADIYESAGNHSVPPVNSSTQETVPQNELEEVAVCTGAVADMTPCSVVTSPDRDYDVCLNGVCVSPGCGSAGCNVPGPYFPLADSGQRNCMRPPSEKIACSELVATDVFALDSDGGGDWNYYGQDAQYGWDSRHSESERFTRRTDIPDEPVVEDNVTGLFWQGCVHSQKGDNCEQKSGEDRTLYWVEALSFCDNLNWGGYSDWRLPDVYALQSIVNYEYKNPTIDPNAFPAMPDPIGTMRRSFWFFTSSTSSGNASDAYIWDFYDGTIDTGAKSYAVYARCVRGGLTPLRTLEVVPGDEPVVVDEFNGLMWQRCASGLAGNDCSVFQDPVGITLAYTREWESEEGYLVNGVHTPDYCEKLTYAGHSDWRMPNVVELFSIADAGETPTGEKIFPEAVEETTLSNYMSSTLEGIDESVEGVSGRSFLFVSMGFGGYIMPGSTGVTVCVRDI